MTDSYLEFIMQQKKSLANVVTAFAHWRTNKSTLGAATPLALRQQAILLLRSHSSSQICSVLKISGSQFKQWQQSPEQPALSVEPDTDFIELPLSDAPGSGSAIKVELRFANENQIHLSGDLDSDFVGSLIGAMKS